MTGPEIMKGVQVPRLGTDEKIRRLRARIALERDVSRASVLIIVPKVEKAARILGRLRGVPALAARYAPVLIPVASVVFRKNTALRTAVRAWGLAKLVKTLARSMAESRSRRAVDVVSYPSP